MSFVISTIATFSEKPGSSRAYSKPTNQGSSNRTDGVSGAPSGKKSIFPLRNDLRTTAIVNGSYDAVKLLIGQGANTEDLSNKEPFNYNALGWAVAHGKTGIAGLLLSRGERIFQGDSGGTALHLVTFNFRRDLMRVLINDYGALFRKPEVLKCTDKRLNTPLHCAAISSPQCINELLLAGADLDFRGPKKLHSRTALAVAVEAGRQDILKFLLEKEQMCSVVALQKISYGHL
jgi:ankyrin repeat protein